ncbi:MAG: hypothetical protein HOH95_02970 [Dehalococcoidia bacterium]|jgi:hypothetical protein|nr:hypothetical protein [Dehalococcoidia bacterium]
MQDRYTGDIGDFGKYALLRALAGLHPTSEPSLSLGVVWYLTDAEMERTDPAGDGRHTAYLKPHQAPRFRSADPELYDSLAALINSNDRRVAAIRERAILGPNTVFYEDRIHTPTPQQRRFERLQHRELWIAAAERAVAPCDIVFLDPDNGLEAASVQTHHKKGPKYAYLNELQRLAGGSRALVVYHHLSRSSDGVAQIRTVGARIRDALPRDYTLDAVWYHRGTARAFLIATPPRYAAPIDRRIAALLAGPWAAHFTREIA